MKLHVSTDDVAAPDRVAFWADLVCAHLVEVDCHSVADPSSFSGSVSKVSLPAMDIAQIRSRGQVVRHTAQMLSHRREDVILINIQRSGSSRLRQSERDALLAVGDLTVYSSDRAYELDFEADFEQTVLIFSRDALPVLRDNLDTLSAITVPGTGDAARLLARLADVAFDSAEGVGRALNTTLEQALFQTIMAATEPLVRDSKPKTPLALYHIERVRAYVNDHLQDPQLGVEAISQGVGLSPPHLHRLFADEPNTLMAWVWEQRLMCCKRALECCVGERRSICQIAFRYGFVDMSHFSRSFRRRFGSSPRDVRGAALGRLAQ